MKKVIILLLLTFMQLLHGDLPEQLHELHISMVELRNKLTHLQTGLDTISIKLSGKKAEKEEEVDDVQILKNIFYDENFLAKKSENPELETDYVEDLLSQSNEKLPAITNPQNLQNPSEPLGPIISSSYPAVVSKKIDAAPESAKQKAKRKLNEQAYREIEADAKKLGIKENDWTLKNSDKAKQLVTKAETQQPESIKQHQKGQFIVAMGELKFQKDSVKEEKARLEKLEEQEALDQGEIKTQKKMLTLAKQDLAAHKESMKTQFGPEIMNQIKSLEDKKKAAHEFKKKIEEEENKFLETPKGKVALIAKETGVTSVNPKKTMKDLESQDGQEKVTFINQQYQNAVTSADNAKKIATEIKEQYEKDRKEILNKYPENELAKAYKEKLALGQKIKKSTLFSLKKQDDEDVPSLKKELKDLDRDFENQCKAAAKIEQETEKNRKEIKVIADRVNKAAEEAAKKAAERD